MQAAAQEMGLNPKNLAVVFSMGFQIFGEVLTNGGVTDPYDVRRGSIDYDTLAGRVVDISHPLMVNRLVGRHPETGQQSFIIQMGDFDLVSGGTVQVLAKGGFFLSWLDEESAVRYLDSALGFMRSREEMKRVLRAKKAGITLADASTKLPPPPGTPMVPRR